MKTKPTQHSVKELRGLGIQPNMIVIRTETPAEQGLKIKLHSLQMLRQRLLLNHLMWNICIKSHLIYKLKTWTKSFWII
jgi:CTP synthase (UTP-ammonia lyase)